MFYTGVYTGGKLYSNAAYETVIYTELFYGAFYPVLILEIQLYIPKSLYIINKDHFFCAYQGTKINFQKFYKKSQKFFTNNF